MKIHTQLCVDSFNVFFNMITAIYKSDGFCGKIHIVQKPIKMEYKA